MERVFERWLSACLSLKEEIPLGLGLVCSESSDLRESGRLPKVWIPGDPVETGP